MYYDVVIIGGGAAGMGTAILSKKNNESVLLMDHNSRVGKKILSTGNGKCNLTNKFCKTALFDDNPEGLFPYYPPKNREFVTSVIDRFDCDDTIAWFEEMGILCEDKNGYIYPLSETASAVLDTLRYQVMLSGTEIQTEYQPMKIRKSKGLFAIDDEITCRKLVLACGGMAAPKSGSDGSGFEYASSFGHRIVKPLPSLCGIKLQGDYFKRMQGVRTECRLNLYNESPKKPLLVSFGNVQMNQYGISGIPAMQLSSFVGRYLEKSKKPLSVNIELLPSIPFDDLTLFIANKLKKISVEDQKQLPLSWILTGLLHKKVIQVVFREVQLNADDDLYDSLERFKHSKQYQYGKVCGKKLSYLDDERIFAARVAGVIKHFSTEVTGICGFEEAQVTSGGVDAAEIDPQTMESKLVNGLFFAGEMIDVDGICGGYNLQWAWSTAYVAASVPAREVKE